MRKIVSVFALIIISCVALGQNPQGFSYQAVLRGTNNELIVKKSIGVRISLLQGSENGSVVFQETHVANSNDNGLISLIIGNGSAVSGNFSQIDWSKLPYFIKTETDLLGGSNYTLTTVSQLMSVPYAIHAKNGLTSGNYVGQMNYWDGKQWIEVTKGDESSILTIQNGVPNWTNKSLLNNGKTFVYLSGDVTDNEAIDIINNEVGPNTQYIYVRNTKNLTKLSFPNVSKVIDIEIQNNEKLNSVTFENLVEVQGNFKVTLNVKLENITFDKLEKIIGNLSIEQDHADILTINAPSLKSGNISQLSSFGLSPKEVILAIPNFTSGNLSLDKDIKTLNLPNFISGVLNVQSDQISEINLPKVVHLDQFSVSSKSIKTIKLPLLSSIGRENYFHNFNVYDCPLLTSIELGQLTTIVDQYFNITNCALSSFQINKLLSNLIKITPSLKNITIDLSNQNPKASPTGQGVIDKNTLIQNGNNVITD